MGQKLYPPYIEGTIPAFYKNDNGTATLVVPFSMNKAVSKSSVTGFHLKMKTVQNSAYILDLSTSSAKDYDIESNYQVSFTIPVDKVNKLNIGQYYKIQLAYDNESQVGYYSTVGIIKFTTKPVMTVSGLSSSSINMHKYSYTGTYSQANYSYSYVDLTMEYTDANGDTQSYCIYKPNTYYELTTAGYELCDDDTYNSSKSYYARNLIVDPSESGYKDSTEKEYSYRFILYDSTSQIVEDSGVLLHDSSKDLNSYESSDSYLFPTDLDQNVSYYLQYTVITNNGLECSSPRYRIMQKHSISPEIDTEIVATLNYDNGYIDINLVGQTDSEGNEVATSGTFLLSRACLDDDYKIWNELYRFVLHGQFPSRWLFRDFTIEQGKTYKYSLQQYNDSGLYSSRLYSNTIVGDFEDAFLYDGTRQLKIKYNPKVSSFKTDYLETKTDTIGSKYPFIFRNGSVEYKEFSLSGLISYQMDEENLFMTEEDLGFNTKLSGIEREGTLKDFKTDEELQEYIDYIIYEGFNDDTISSDLISDANEGIIAQRYKNQQEQKEWITDENYKTTNLTGYNISAERKFKLAVLDWLNNGEVKLFRSPGEGNYIVRLMNISLSPEDQVGRMLHTFNATAYEMADFTYDSLNTFNIISIDEPDNTQLRWATVPLRTTEDMSNDENERYVQLNDVWYAEGEILNHTQAETVRFTDMMPGSIVYFTQLLNGVETESSFVIGSTGAYLLDTGLAITSIRIPQDAHYQGSVTFSFYNDAQNLFNEVESIEISDHLGNQLIGNTPFTVVRTMSDDDAEDLAAETDVTIVSTEEVEGASHYQTVTFTTNNIVRNITNVKDSLLTFLYLDFQVRPIGYCYYWNGSYYRDKAHYNAISVYEAKDDEAWENYLANVIGQSGLDPFALFKYETNVLSLTSGKWTMEIESLSDTFAFYYDPKRQSKVIIDADSRESYSDFLNLAKDTLTYIYNNIEIDSSLNSTDYQETTFTYTDDNLKISLSTTANNTYLNYYYDDENEQWKTISGSTHSLRYYINSVFLTQVKEKINALEDYEDYSTCVYIDGNKIDIKEIQRYYITHPFKFSNISLDNGVMLNYGYQLQEIHYSIESSIVEVHNLYSEYLEAINALDTLLTGLTELTTSSAEQITIARNLINTKYQAYIQALELNQAIWEANAL